MPGINGMTFNQKVGLLKNSNYPNQHEEPKYKIKKKLSKEDRKISVQDPSKLLAEFSNVVVIKNDEAYAYDS